MPFTQLGGMSNTQSQRHWNGNRRTWGTRILESGWSVPGLHRLELNSGRRLNPGINLSESNQKARTGNPVPAPAPRYRLTRGVGERMAGSNELGMGVRHACGVPVGVWGSTAQNVTASGTTANTGVGWGYHPPSNHPPSPGQTPTELSHLFANEIRNN